MPPAFFLILVILILFQLYFLEFSKSKTCQLPSNGTPVPVILIALGRSGSSIVWSTISALTGERNIAHELTGGNPQTSFEFFNDLETNSNRGYDWAIQELCNIYEYRTDITKDKTGVLGFQWKPFLTSWDHPYSMEGMKEIVKYHHPKIKLIYLTRNPLDVKASNIKHNLMAKQKKDIDKSKRLAHCDVGDEACLKEHSKFSKDVTLPTGKGLIQELNGAANRDAKIWDRLTKDVHAEFIHVSYEELFFSDDAKEWMNIFQYLGVGPTAGLTMKDVQSTFAYASTTGKKPRNETIANYEDVRKTLIGSKHEYLLRS